MASTLLQVCPFSLRVVSVVGITYLLPQEERPLCHPTVERWVSPRSQERRGLSAGNSVCSHTERDSLGVDGGEWTSQA